MQALDAGVISDGLRITQFPAATAETSGPRLRLNGKFQGETTQLFFQDSCFGFSMDFLGRDHATAQFVYLKFAEIAEIVLP